MERMVNISFLRFWSNIFSGKQINTFILAGIALIELIPNDKAWQRTLRSNLAFVGTASLAYSAAAIKLFSIAFEKISVRYP